MERPYIICHMTASLDGKVTGSFLEQENVQEVIEQYYKIHRAYQADAFACGRITMEGSFTGGFQPDLTPFADAALPYEDYIADKEAKFFAVAFDRKGRLGWTASRIADEDPGYDNAHIIEVLCEGVNPAYLAYLQSIGVSYIFAGKQEMDVPLAVKKLKMLFGIETLLLEGGSVLNGAFLRADVVDALSLVVAPVTAEKKDKPLFWDGELKAFQLEEVTQFTDNIWMKYHKA